MTQNTFLSKPWVRILVFVWGIVFPVVFVALPLMKVVTGEAAFTMGPVWAFAVWILSPLVVMILAKNFRGERKVKGIQDD